MTALFNLDPSRDEGRRRHDVHYRLYQPLGEPPTVICVQDFDYPDYDATRFVTYDVYEDEQSAEWALDVLKAKARRLLGLD